MPERARPYDAVFSTLKPEDIDRLRFKDEALLPGMEEVRELGEGQRKLLHEAMARRAQAAAENKRVQLSQTMSAGLFESGNRQLIDATLEELGDESILEGLGDADKASARRKLEKNYDVVADIVLGFKRKLSGRFGGRSGGSRDQADSTEQVMDNLNLGPEEYRQLQENNPAALEMMKRMFGGNEEMAKKFMNWYGIDYLIDQGFDSQRVWDEFRKGFILFSIPGGLDEVTYGQLMNEDWENPSSENEEMVRKVQAWQLMVNLLAVRNGPYAQPAQIAHRQYPTMGILGSTYPAIMMEAAQKVEAFARMINWNTEKVAEHLVEVTAAGNELSSLLYGVRKAVVFEARGGGKGSFELSVPGSMDQFVGNRAKIVKDEQGRPLYSFHGKIGSEESDAHIDLDNVPLETILDGLSENQRAHVLNSEWLVPVWDRDLTGRVVEGQQLYTWTDTIKSEKGKGALVEWVVDQIESQGIRIEDIEILWATAENGEQLTKDHDSYRLRYQKIYGELKRGLKSTIDRYVQYGANPQWAFEMAQFEEGIDVDRLARREAALNLISDAVVTAYGRYADLGFGIIDMLGQSDMWDVRQLLDNLPELTNKAMTGFSYNEKYAILSAPMRKMIQSYIRTVLAWKRKDVDPILVSLYGKKGVTAAWRDPLSPEKAPIIPEVRLVDGRRLSSLKGSKRMVNVDGLDITENQLYQDLTTTVEALFYLKSDWRSGSGARQNIANHLVLLATQRGGKEAGAQAMIYFDDYVKKFQGMAPQEFPRGRDEVALVLQSLLRTRRVALNMMDWKDVLKTFGYENMTLPTEEYVGVRGLEKLTEIRSSGQWLMGEMQKMFKYMSKYPGLAAAESKALGDIVPALNNALHPLFESLLGGMPDRLENFKPDQIGEAIAKGLVNVLFMGTRNQKSAWTFIKQVIEKTAEASSLIGYMSGEEQRKNVRDVVMAIDAFSDKAMNMSEYKYSGGDEKGEHGSSRAWLEVKQDDISRESDVVRALRMAGFTVTYPNGSLISDADLENLLKHGQISQDMLPKEGLSETELASRQQQLESRLKDIGEFRPRSPYVSWGIQPQFLQVGCSLSDDGTKINVPVSKHESLGLYGHLGKETLMTVVLMEYLQDAMLMTELDANRVLVDLVKKRGGDVSQSEKIWEVYKKEKRRLLEEMNRSN